MMSGSSCLFCRVAKGEIPAERLEETQEFLAFRDIRPQAPTHVLIIPKLHIAALRESDESHVALLGRALRLAAKLATKLGLADGFRVVINDGAAAGQTVFHLHIHLLGGRPLGWPPG